MDHGTRPFIRISRYVNHMQHRTTCFTIISLRFLPVCIARPFATLNTTRAADYTPISLRLSQDATAILVTPPENLDAKPRPEKYLLTIQYFEFARLRLFGSYMEGG